MEIMGSLLLCALFVLAPQALGKFSVRTSSDLQIKYNNSKLIQQKTSSHKKLLLNLNGPPMVNKFGNLQSIFNDHACKKCNHCMERTLNAYKTNTHVIDNQQSAEDVRNNAILSDHERRYKRDAAVVEKVDAKTKKPKPKKNKSVSVTKYNLSGEVYALKVKETNVKAGRSQQNETVVTTCQVYNVKKAFDCESPESDMILAAAKRKAQKKIAKKEQLKTTTTTQANEKKVKPATFRKRHVEVTPNENFMSSIEEQYSE